MPLYTYTCDTCGMLREHRVRYDDRDETQLCPSSACSGQMRRGGLETFAIGKPAYQMAGILADGTKIPGQFGKDAKRRRKKKP